MLPRAVAALCTVAFLSTPATAQQVACPAGSTVFPCGSQIDSVQIAPAPLEFRIQARVAQAKIAIGNGRFETFAVKVLEGATEVCRERFTNVDVVNGVVNLRIGPEMNCDLGQVVESRSNLKLQLCPGGEQCLPAMDFGSVPAVIKAGVAARARKAHRAEVAAQAQYAARLDADTDVATTGRVRTGYYRVTKEGSDGLLSWTPLASPSARTLILTGRDAGTGLVKPLTTLTLGASRVVAKGHLEVVPRPGQVGVTVKTGGVTTTGRLTVSGAFSTTGGLTVSGGLSATGAATVEGGLTASQNLRAASARVLAGDLVVANGTGAKTDGLVVTGPVAATSLTTTSALRAGSSATTGGLVIPSGEALLASGGAAKLTESGGIKTITRGNVVLARFANGRLEIAPPGGGIGRVRIRTGLAGTTATFQGAVTLPTDLSCRFGETRDSTTKACVDIDECATGAAACGQNATCTNQTPGYTCTCNAGFIGNGYVCTK